MNKYTIYCTEEQTLKALELGAPIARQSPNSDAPVVSYGEERNELGQKVNKLWNCPTTEQMIGWLEERDIYINVMWDDTLYIAIVYAPDKGRVGCTAKLITSRKEATLAGIDAALEYLSDEEIKS